MWPIYRIAIIEKSATLDQIDEKWDLTAVARVNQILDVKDKITALE